MPDRACIRYNEAPFPLLWYSHVWERIKIHSFSFGFMVCFVLKQAKFVAKSYALTYQLPKVANISQYR